MLGCHGQAHQSGEPMATREKKVHTVWVNFIGKEFIEAAKPNPQVEDKQHSFWPRDSARPP